MTSTQDKYSALKRKYTKLMASYRKISDLLADKNKEIIGGAEGTGDNNNMKQYAFLEDKDLQELIRDNSKNLPYVENLFQIIDYIFFKFALFQNTKNMKEEKSFEEISQHFESDFNNWKTKNNADFLNHCILFLIKNIDAYKQYFNNKYILKSETVNSSILYSYLLGHNIFDDFDTFYRIIIEYFAPQYDTVEEVLKQYGFRYVEVGGGGNCFYYSIIHQLSGMTSDDYINERYDIELRKMLCDYIRENKDKILKKVENYENLFENLISEIKNDGIWVESEVTIKAMCDIIGKKIVIYQISSERVGDEKLTKYKLIPGFGMSNLIGPPNIDEIYLLYNPSAGHYQSLVPLDYEHIYDSNIGLEETKEDNDCSKSCLMHFFDERKETLKSYQS
jgi:hypothetical protein